MKDKISVRDAMTSQVITITPDKSIIEAAKLMRDNNIGGVVVIENGDPVGIITERDLVDIVADNKNLEKTKVKDVMSSPLITISPNASLLDAAKLMNKTKTRKLPVIKSKRLVGIITAEDIVRVAPREIELLLELAKIKTEESVEFIQPSTEGICEVCGNYSENLFLVGSTYVCIECKEELEESEL